VDNKMSIKELCFESGFNNFSCFHKNFKQLMGKTPQRYQQEYLDVAG
jgi:YesN/AraC family two-component response regulator